MRKFTKAETVVRKAKVYGGDEAWWYVDKSVCDFYIRTDEGKVIRMSIGTRYFRNALFQMDKESWPWSK